MARFISYLASFVLAAGGIRAESIVGSWLTQGAGESKSDAVLTFTANGIYFLAEDGSSVLDPSGKDGMERGTYSWNPTTKAFSSKTQVDTNGQWGLSSGDIRKITVSANTLKFGNVTFKRIQPNAKNLDGPWLLKEGSGYALVTFLPGGSYFMVQDGKADNNVKSGMERGTFNWDPQTGVFTRRIIRDTNGSWGFSDLAKRKIFLGKNTITIEVEGDGTAKLSRVMPP